MQGSSSQGKRVTSEKMGPLIVFSDFFSIITKGDGGKVGFNCSAIIVLSLYYTNMYHSVEAIVP